ncbi:MAG: hypothetical protein ACRCZ9_08320 [Fusobacteriaceae bacterium]
MDNNNKEIVYLISEAIVPNASNMRLTPGKKTVIFDTRLTNSSVMTANGNKYDKQMMEEAIADDFVQSRLKSNGMYGEMDHPTRDNPERYVQVYNKFRSHRFNRFWWEGDQLWGECETAISQYGRDMADMLSQGTIPAFSLRAAGSIKGPSRHLKLITYDLVFIPSDATAWGDMNTRKEAMYAESKSEWIQNMEAGDAAKKAFLTGCSYNRIEGRFEEVNDAVGLIGEAICGFKPTEVIYDKNDKVLGLCSESIMTKHNVSKSLAKELDDFFRN